ncbi:ribonuclease [Kurthia sp. 3B1D]|uniref:Ribonuclease n=1 Tax=Candidatus Kurthia intestinigallinarum TaxID=1562256 RepID=A0A433RYB4_9BACL|nr:YihY/virulence factor BrkB family protein [Kurthia sp. 3B1D]RUS58273.1 ribonuclease [Kurthia sp. 3B1D]
MGKKKKNVKKRKGPSSEVFDKVKMLQIEKKHLQDVHKPQYDLTTWKGFIQGFIQKVTQADLSGMGAQLAYFFLLSLFPLLIFVMTLVPFLNLPQEQVYTMMKELLPEQVYSLIGDTLKDVLENRNGGLLSVGILATLWSASNGVNALIKSLNQSYGKAETRPFIIARSMSVVFTLVLILLVVVALILPVFGSQIGHFLANTIGLGEQFGAIFDKFRILLPPLVIFCGLVFMYWLGPNVKMYLRSAIPGAIVSTVCWLVISYVFSIYINNFSNYSATYGSIGGIIILMLWLYITGMVLMIGGLVNAIMQERKEQIDTRRRRLSAQ